MCSYLLAIGFTNLFAIILLHQKIKYGQKVECPSKILDFISLKLKFETYYNIYQIQYVRISWKYNRKLILGSKRYESYHMIIINCVIKCVSFTWLNDSIYETLSKIAFSLSTSCLRASSFLPFSLRIFDWYSISSELS